MKNKINYIAELCQNHLGKISNIEKMIYETALNGANIIKTQYIFSKRVVLYTATPFQFVFARFCMRMPLRRVWSSTLSTFQLPGFGHLRKEQRTGTRRSLRSLVARMRSPSTLRKLLSR